jgi:hypothetical protein
LRNPKSPHDQDRHYPRLGRIDKFELCWSLTENTDDGALLAQIEKLNPKVNAIVALQDCAAYVPALAGAS